MSGAIDLSQLPAPVVVESLDYDATLKTRRQQLISYFPEEEQEAVTRTLALSSDPGEKLLEFSVYLENLLRQRINEAAQANMLALATGSDLDNLAADFNVQRLTVTPADNTVTPAIPAVMETDTALRLRTQQAMEALSVAGPTEAYEYFARSADGRVSDAKADSPSPACVTVTILSTEGDGTAGDDLLKSVSDALSPEDRRPVADRVTVQSAEIIPYQVDAVLVLSEMPQSELIKKTVEKQLTDYITARRRIGESIRYNILIGALKCDGVENIILNAPSADIEVSKTQAASCTRYQINVVAESGDQSSD